jgi:DNA-binding transcriptional LysR family regulator
VSFSVNLRQVCRKDRQELRSGTIIHCLQDFHLAASDLYIIYPEREFLPPKVKAFIEMLISGSMG